MKSRSLTARRPALWAKKNRTPSKIAAANKGATAHTTTALVSRDATAASQVPPPLEGSDVFRPLAADAFAPRTKVKKKRRGDAVFAFGGLRT